MSQAKISADVAKEMKSRLMAKPSFEDWKAGLVSDEEFCAGFRIQPVRTRIKTIRGR